MCRNTSRILYTNKDKHTQCIDLSLMVQSPACHCLLECHCTRPVPLNRCLQTGDTSDTDNKPMRKSWGFAVRQKEVKAALSLWFLIPQRQLTEQWQKDDSLQSHKGPPPRSTPGKWKMQYEQESAGYFLLLPLCNMFTCQEPHGWYNETLSNYSAVINWERGSRSAQIAKLPWQKPAWYLQKCSKQLGEHQAPTTSPRVNSWWPLKQIFLSLQICIIES